MFSPCPTCGGSGVAGHFEHVNPDTGEHLGNEPVECPDCVGGRVVSESVIEEMKSVIGATFVEKMGWAESKPFAALEAYAIAEYQARAVGRVVLEHMEEQ